MIQAWERHATLDSIKIKIEGKTFEISSNRRKIILQFKYYC